MLALDFAESGSEGRLRRRHPTFKRRIELSLRTVAALTPESMDDALVAARVLEKSRDYKLLTDQTLFGAVASVASAINWNNVPKDLRKRWHALLDAVEPTNDVLASDILVLAQALGRELSPETVRLRGIEGVAALINGWISNPTDTDLTLASAECANYLERIQRDAASGVICGYFYSPAALASYMIADFSRVELWPSLLDLLKNPLVSSGDKADALGVLAREKAPMPDDVVARIKSMGDSIASGKELDLDFGTSPIELDSLWRSVLLVQGIVPLAAMQSELVRSASHRNSVVRSRTAETLSLAVRNDPTSDWAVVLLLQLSHDDDAVVRHWAARGLGYVGWQGTSPLSSVVRSRVVELIEEEGISSALGALRGLIDYATDNQNRFPLWCVETVGLLAESHVSSNIRAAAGRVLSECELEPLSST
jgi:hypothetical protein